MRCKKTEKGDYEIDRREDGEVKRRKEKAPIIH